MRAMGWRVVSRGGAVGVLYAFNPEQSGSTMTPIFKAIAGNWPNVGAARTWFLWLVANGKGIRRQQ
jgi:hypothetical protein